MLNGGSFLQRVAAAVVVAAIVGAWGFIYTRASADDVKAVKKTHVSDVRDLDRRLDEHDTARAVAQTELDHIKAEQARQSTILETIQRAVAPRAPIPPPVRGERGG